MSVNFEISIFNVTMKWHKVAQEYVSILSISLYYVIDNTFLLVLCLLCARTMFGDKSLLKL